MTTSAGIKGRKAVFLLFVTAAILLSGTAIYSLVRHSVLLRREVPARPLPLDADTLVRDFTFSHDFPGGSLKMSGKQLVRRGQKLFAVRSTIVKTTSFDDVSGVYTDKKNKVEFAAKRLEWDLVMDKPLTLQDIQRLSINSTRLEHIRTVKMNFEKHVVRVYGGETKTYLLEQ